MFELFKDLLLLVVGMGIGGMIVAIVQAGSRAERKIEETRTKEEL